MKSERKALHTKSLSLKEVADNALLASFDPVIEGSTFQILEEGLDPAKFGRAPQANDEIDAPEVLSTFDLSATLARIPAKLFFRIGEVAELLEVKTYVLRFWETEFSVISPTKSRSGQRVYRKKDVEMLLLIKHLLYVERFSIEGARKRLREIKAKGAGKSKSAPEAPKKEASLTPGRREEIQALIGEIEALANPDLSRFFRF